MDLTRHPKLATDLPAMDDDHWELMAALAELAAVVHAGGPREAVSRTLGRLHALTVTHFAAEERLMHDHGYPMASSHVAQHARFATELAELLTGPVLTQHRVRQLETWFARHIELADRPLADWLLTGS